MHVVSIISQNCIATCSPFNSWYLLESFFCSSFFAMLQRFLTPESKLCFLNLMYSGYISSTIPGVVVKGFNVPSSKERRIACAAGPLLDQGWSLLTVLSVWPIGRFVGLWKKRYREIVWIMRTWKWKEGSVESISTVKGSRSHSKISFLPLNANNLDFESKFQNFPPRIKNTAFCFECMCMVYLVYLTPRFR